MKSVFSEEDQNRIGRTNTWRSLSNVRFIAVECPECGASGGSRAYVDQPKCFDCKRDVLMEPAWHDGITCSWDEAVTYFKELDISLGNAIKS